MNNMATGYVQNTKLVVNVGYRLNIGGMINEVDMTLSNNILLQTLLLNIGHTSN